MTGHREIHEGGGDESMRDPADLVTATLPGVESLPPIPFDQLPQAARREAMQFQGPKERPRCGACKHVEVVSNCFVPGGLRPERMRCKLGDFPVQAGAVCARYEAKP